MDGREGPEGSHATFACTSSDSDLLPLNRGWTPEDARKEGGSDAFFYEDGLVVTFDKEAWSAVSMVFTPPQPNAPARSPR